MSSKKLIVDIHPEKLLEERNKLQKSLEKTTKQFEETKKTLEDTKKLLADTKKELEETKKSLEEERRFNRKNSEKFQTKKKTASLRSINPSAAITRKSAKDLVLEVYAAMAKRDLVEMVRIFSIIEENPDDLPEVKREMVSIDAQTSETVLHTAMRTLDYNLIKTLIEFFQKHNMDLNIKDKFGWTILHTAVSNSTGTEIDEQILEMILKQPNIRADVVNDNLNTPLHYFVQKFSLPSCSTLGELLIKLYPQNINKKNQGGETPIHKAIFNNFVRVLMVELLIKNGADVNSTTTSYGETALHYAVRLERKDLIKILIGAGADIKIKDIKEYRTPYDLAVSTNQKDMARLFKDCQELKTWLDSLNLEHHFLHFFREEAFLDVFADADPLSELLDSLDIKDPQERSKLLESQPKLKEALNARNFETSLQKASQGNLRQSTASAPIFNLAKMSEEISNVQELRSQLVNEDDEKHILKHSMLEFTKELGSGQYSRVYKGLYNKKVVAIKVLKTEGSRLATIQAEFKKEFYIMRLLKHPYLVNFIGAVLHPRICIVMDFCSRGSLFGILKDSKLNIKWDLTFKWLLEMFTAVNFLHTYEPPIFHRDIKSQNFLINDDWQCLLADFGLARVQTNENVETMSKVRGTYLYTAPELFSSQAYNDKCDVFSLAVVLWEIATRLVTGEYSIPYSEYKDLRMAFQIYAVVAKKGLRPTINKDTPSLLTSLIETCWQQNPENRISAAQVLQKLLEIISNYNQNKEEWNKVLKVSNEGENIGD